jgi:AraC-like DNA-binding protein
VPFQSYIQELRLSFAKSLLGSAHISVTEACHAAGFNTLTHFEKAFKRKYGKTPRFFQSK